MRGLRLPARLESALWEKTLGLRRFLRAFLGRLSRQRQRRRGFHLLEPHEREMAVLPWPLVTGDNQIPDAAGLIPEVDPTPSDAPYVVFAEDPSREIPAEALEALVLVAAAEDVDLLVTGWAEPSQVPGTPPSQIRPLAGGFLWLVRTAERPDRSQQREDSPWLAKIVPLLGPVSAPLSEAMPERAWPFFTAAGPYRFPQHTAPESRGFTTRADLRLAAMPELDGPPTVLFLLPFLAVGGAERLLLDLLAATSGLRALVVTCEPHLASLGQNLSRARELTPHVYTLGDWLPRETHLGVLCHLLRRYRVETLVSWNGTTFFYDQVPKIRLRFPQLKILAQLYHHEGGFFTRTSPAVRAALDGHLAVNRDIQTSLIQELGVPEKQVHLLYHGVELPEPGNTEAEVAARHRLRGGLDLPDQALVVGSFIRLHPQKRPLDIVALARRFEGTSVYFLLVGGGPLENELAAELARRPVKNLRRLPLLPDARPLFAAIDLCLMSSAYEGLPVFLLDGLARGIPCVSTAVGEVPELLAEGGGICAPVGDLDRLATAIETFLDADKRREAGSRGRRTVEQRFSLEVYARAYQKVLLSPKVHDEHG